jgi:hypothetical protein
MSLLQHSSKALRSSQHQHEVLHRRGRLGELPSSYTSNSRGRAGLSKHPRHQKVSPSKLSGHLHSLGRRHIRPPGPHHFRCCLLQHCSSNSRGTSSVGNTKRSRAGTSNNGWNSGPTQRRSPHLGRGCSDLPDLHLRPASMDLLQVTGGDLSTEKCVCYLIVHRGKNGLPMLLRKCEFHRRIKITSNATEHTSGIKRKAATHGHRTLGFHFTGDVTSSAHKRIKKFKAKEYSEAIISSTLDR